MLACVCTSEMSAGHAALVIMCCASVRVRVLMLLVYHGVVLMLQNVSDS